MKQNFYDQFQLKESIEINQNSYNKYQDEKNKKTKD